MEDYLDFMRANRPSFLIGGGVLILFLWLLGMINYHLFDLRPFGSESDYSMGCILGIFLPLSPILLFATYWIGSKDSPLKGNFMHSVAEFSYITFKKIIFVLAILTAIVGAPRIKYYQMRAVEGGSGLEELSYYERKTIFNIFNDSYYFVDSTSYYEEDISPVGVIPLDSADIDSDSSSSTSKSSKSDVDMPSGLAELILTILAGLIVVLLFIYYLSLLALALIFPNFWLVSIACIAIGMICLGVIDIHDGPKI